MADAAHGLLHLRHQGVRFWRHTQPAAATPPPANSADERPPQEQENVKLERVELLELEIIERVIKEKEWWAPGGKTAGGAVLHSH